MRRFDWWRRTDELGLSGAWFVLVLDSVPERLGTVPRSGVLEVEGPPGVRMEL